MHKLIIELFEDPESVVGNASISITENGIYNARIGQLEKKKIMKTVEAWLNEKMNEVKKK